MGCTCPGCLSEGLHVTEERTAFLNFYHGAAWESATLTPWAEQMGGICICIAQNGCWNPEQQCPWRWDEQYSDTSSYGCSVPGFLSECICLPCSAVTLLALWSLQLPYFMAHLSLHYNIGLEEVWPSLPCLLVACDVKATFWGREKGQKDRRLSWLHRESGSGISGKRSNSHNELELAGRRWWSLEVSLGGPHLTHNTQLLGSKL